MQVLSTESQVLSEQETVRRLETVLMLNRALEEGDKLLAAGDKLAARGRYEYAVNNSHPFGGTAEINARAKAKLSMLLVIFGDEAAKKKDYVSARKHYEEALALQPDNAAAQAGLRSVTSQTRSVSEKYPGNKAVSDELLEKVTNIQKLIFEGDELYKTGQYQRAIARYQEVLRIDPYNDIARMRIEKTEKTKEQAATLQYKAQKEKAIANVEGNWADPIPQRPRPAPEIVTTTFVQEKSAALSQKLKEIIIPELNFTDVDVADAIAYLEEQSRALDPEKKGVNFVLKTSSSEPPPPPAEDGTATPPPPSSVNRNLTLSLRNVPLDEVLRFITNLTNLKYEVEEYAVFILPANETGDILQVRTYSVPPKFFSLDLTRVTTNDAGALESSVHAKTKDARKELEDKGVTFPAGASAAYLPRTAKLVVRNTLQQLNLIDQLLQREVGESKMIEIEAKFLEFTQDKLDNLSFNWRIDGFNDIDEDTGLAVPNTGSDSPPNIDPSNFDNYLRGINDPTNPTDTLFLDPRSLTSSVNANAGGTTALRDSRALPPNNLDRLLGIGGNRTPNTFGMSAVIANAGAQFLMTALQSTVGADLLSAPRVTTIDGQPAKLRSVRELRYPTEYEPPEVPVTEGDAGGFVSTVIPATPSDFETRDVGVTLNVTANASPDRRINLILKPQVTEFQGFINYGQDAETIVGNGSIQFFVFDPDGPGGLPPITTFIPVPATVLSRQVIAEGVSLQPVFSIREVETKVQVIDGQTVIMGGFIRDDTAEIEDKVPFFGDLPGIGRIFRSKAKQSIKRNLIIFVTARLIKPDGTPRNLTESELDAMELSMEETVPVSAPESGPPVPVSVK